MNIARVRPPLGTKVQSQNEFCLHLLFVRNLHDTRNITLTTCKKKWTTTRTWMNQDSNWDNLFRVNSTSSIFTVQKKQRIYLAFKVACKQITGWNKIIACTSHGPFPISFLCSWISSMNYLIFYCVIYQSVCRAGASYFRLVWPLWWWMSNA